MVRNGYGPNWREQKLKALERDEYRCTKCGGKLGIAVHHKRKIRYFASVETGTVDYEKANDLSNLTTLCRACHKVADQHDAPSKRGFVYISK